MLQAHVVIASSTPSSQVTLKMLDGVRVNFLVHLGMGTATFDGMRCHGSIVPSILTLDQVRVVEDADAGAEQE
jgi:hypothetical protein